MSAPRRPSAMDTPESVLSGGPEPSAGPRNIAQKSRRIRAGESVSMRFEGGHARKPAAFDGTVYEDLDGNEIIVYDEPELLEQK